MEPPCSAAFSGRNPPCEQACKPLGHLLGYGGLRLQLVRGYAEAFTAQMQSCEVPAPLLSLSVSKAKAATPRRRHQHAGRFFFLGTLWG